jgi:hypothetical protein
LADAAVIRPKIRARPAAVGVTIAIAAHVAILTGLILAVEIPRLPPAPAMQVSLVPAFKIAPARRAPPAHRRVVERPIAPRAAAIVGPERPATLPIPAAPPDAQTREKLLSAPFVEHGAVREGLRTTAGCADADWLKLTPAEQEACRQRAHALGQGAGVYAVGPSSPSQRAFLDKQAARNEKRQRALEAPPTHPMSTCEGRMSNLGFSCVP